MRHLTRKTIISLIVTAVVSYLVLVLLITAGTVISDLQRRDSMHAKMDRLSEAIELLSADYQGTVGNFTTNLNRNVDMVATVMRNASGDGVYTGPRIFDDGFVVEMENGQVRYPDGISPQMLSITPEQVMNEHVEGTLNLTSAGGESIPVYVMIKHIVGNSYYVDWTTTDEFELFLETSTDSEKRMKSLETVYDGSLVLLERDSDGNWQFRYKSEKFEDDQTPQDLKVDEVLAGEIFPIIGGDTYETVFREMPDMGLTAIFYTPFANLAWRTLGWAAIPSMILLLVAVTLIVWNMSVQRTVRDTVLTEVQKKMYAPARVWRFTWLIGLVGACVMFVASIYMQAMSTLFTETSSQRESLSALMTQLNEAEDQERNATREQNEWYVYLGEKLGTMLNLFPEQMNHDLLEEISRILGTQYIMIYGADGREIVCSGDYIHFSLGQLPGQSTTDFRRLLQGVPSIMHEPEVDETTGILSRMYGIRFSLENGEYGALILAVDPSQNQIRQTNADVSSVMKSIVAPGTLMLAIDKETGVIRYASDDVLKGNEAGNVGFQSGQLRGEAMEYFSINGVTYYGVSKEQDGLLYYSLILNSQMQGTSRIYVAITMAVYVLFYVILAVCLMHGYNRRNFEHYAVIGKNVVHGTTIQVEDEHGRFRKTTDPSKRWAKMPESWRNRLPEEKARLVFEILLAFFMLVMVGGVENGEGESSMVSFILNGQWTRGVNLFAFTSILMLIATVILIVLFLRLVIGILCSVLGTKGETICRLVGNLIEYVAIIVVLYYAFGYLGINTSALLASVGLISLAISLGARDLVASILAGITIVFEGEFQVGDMVEIGGYRGRVQEIGVRSTKILGRGGNIKIIENQDVKNVINLTQLNSWYPCDLVVTTDQPLEEVEKKLTDALPEIGRRIPEIISGPYYKGVLSMNGRTMTLSVIAECNESDYHSVQRQLNRELQQFCNEKGIKLA
ncbi:MAG: mechanosensitive ion channel [Clostridia bacterium]|nr:mechanosensitive ion channel [Clostridia bacterium]